MPHSSEDTHAGCHFTLLILSGLLFASHVQAQTAPLVKPAYLAAATGALPEAPSAVAYSSSALLPDSQSYPPAARQAGRYDDTIEANETAPAITGADKFLMGLRGSVSPPAAIGWVLAAGYSQGVEGSPNYTQDGKGFAQRVGAAAARAGSEEIFSVSVLAPILHQDPRYYVMGPKDGHRFVKRTAYAVTRTLVTKTDAGHKTINLWLLGGNLAGAYLTKAYYPTINTTNTEVLSTFGGSIGGTALGYFFTEFFGSAANVLLFKHHQ